EDVLPVEEEPRVHVPRDAVHGAVDLVGLPDAVEVVVAIDDRRSGDEGVERSEAIERGELGDPGVAELADIGRRIPYESRQQFLMRSPPRNLLHPHADVRMLALERRHEGLDRFALDPKPPEVDRSDGIAPSVAGCQNDCGEQAEDGMTRAPNHIDLPTIPPRTRRGRARER